MLCNLLKLSFKPNELLQKIVKTLSNHKIDNIFKAFEKRMFELMCYTLLYNKVDDVISDVIAIGDEK